MFCGFFRFLTRRSHTTLDEDEEELRKLIDGIPSTQPQENTQKPNGMMRRIFKKNTDLFKGERDFSKYLSTIEVALAKLAEQRKSVHMSRENSRQEIKALQEMLSSARSLSKRDTHIAGGDKAVSQYASMIVRELEEKVQIAQRRHLENRSVNHSLDKSYKTLNDLHARTTKQLSKLRGEAVMNSTLAESSGLAHKVAENMAQTREDNEELMDDMDMAILEEEDRDEDDEMEEESRSEEKPFELSESEHEEEEELIKTNQWPAAPRKQIAHKAAHGKSYSKGFKSKSRLVVS